VGKEDGTVGDYSLQREADTHGHFGKGRNKKNNNSDSRQVGSVGTVVVDPIPRREETDGSRNPYRLRSDKGGNNLGTSDSYTYQKGRGFGLRRAEGAGDSMGGV